mgnify:CR=1 FL=1
MFGLDKHKQAGQNIFMSSMQGLANVLAVGVTFVATGPIYSGTEEFVIEFAESHYGEMDADLVTSSYGVILALAIFFLSRATLATALMFGAVAILMRFA